MSDALFFSLMAVAFYALELFVADWKLSYISPRFLTLCYAIGIAVFAFLSVFHLKPGQIVTPKGEDWIYILLMIVASFSGAVAHFAALNRASGALVLGVFYTLLPVAVSLFTYIFRGQLPSMKLITAWILAGVAVVLINTDKIGS